MRRFGLSEGEPVNLTPETLSDDLEAVVDASEIDSFDLMPISGLTPPAITYAAAHGDRIEHLILWGAIVTGDGRRFAPRARIIDFALDEYPDLAKKLMVRGMFGEDARGQTGVRRVHERVQGLSGSEGLLSWPRSGRRQDGSRCHSGSDASNAAAHLRLFDAGRDAGDRRTDRKLRDRVL